MSYAQHISGPLRSATRIFPRGWIPVLVVATVLRIGWAIAVPVEPISDANAYYTLAKNLSIGENFGWTPGVPTAQWPVGPAFLYSVFFRVFGEHFLPIVVFLVLLSVASVWLLMVLTARWIGSRASVAAGACLALWPSQIQFTTVSSTEIPFSFMLLTICLLWSDRRVGSWTRIVACGVMIGLASHLRPTAMLLPVVLAGQDLVRGRRPLLAARAAFVMLVLVGAVTAPWSMRNLAKVGHYGLTATFGREFWNGNHPGTDGGYQSPSHPTYKALIDAGLSPAEISRELGSRAFQYVREHPLEFIGRSFVKLVRQHSRETIGVVWNKGGLASRYPPQVYDLLHLQSAAYWITMIGLAIGGIVLLARNNGVIQVLSNPAVGIWAYFALVHAVTVIQDRYSFQSVLFIAMLASVSVMALWARWAGTTGIFDSATTNAESQRD